MQPVQSSGHFTNQQIAEAFSRHQFKDTYPYFAESLQWNNVGAEQLDGKDAVIAACEKSAGYLSNASTTFSQFKIVVSDGSVVIDSVATYVKPGEQPSYISSCDLYDFTDSKLTKITSYAVELASLGL